MSPGWAPRQTLFVCVRDRGGKGESCAGSGSRRLLKHMQAMLDREAIASDELTLRPCGCLGLCSKGPVMLNAGGKATGLKKPPKAEKRHGKIYKRVAEDETRFILKSLLNKPAKD